MKMEQVNPRAPVVIDFHGTVDDFATNELSIILSDLANINARDVKLAITTPGGNVDRGMYLYNLIRALPLDVTTHNIGTVDSIGNVIYLAGKKRLATSNSRFMLHGVARSFRGGPGGEVSLNERSLRDALTYVERDNKIISDTIAFHTSLTHEMLSTAFSVGDTILTPEDAREKGIVHEISEFKIDEGAQVIPVWSRG